MENCSSEKISWEKTYPNEELRQSARIYAHFFREYEIRLRNEKKKEKALARNSLENIII
jgi:hypothetical protein